MHIRILHMLVFMVSVSAKDLKVGLCFACYLSLLIKLLGDIGQIPHFSHKSVSSSPLIHLGNQGYGKLYLQVVTKYIIIFSKRGIVLFILVSVIYL